MASPNTLLSNRIKMYNRFKYVIIHILRKMYNKVAIYKWREAHPEEYKGTSSKANSKYRNANLDSYKERDKLHKRYMTEVKRFRNIDIF